MVERSTDGVNFILLTLLAARNGTSNITHVDAKANLLGSTYFYRVAAINTFVKSVYSNTASILVAATSAPVIQTSSAARQGGNEHVTLTWTNVIGETGYTIQWSTSNTFTTISGSGSVGANITTFTTGAITRQTWWFRVGAVNALGTTWSIPISVAPAP
jgi:hypothetical protein